MKDKEAGLADQPHEAARMLFYTKTDEDIYSDKGYWMSGNRIDVRMQNLDRVLR